MSASQAIPGLLAAANASASGGHSNQHESDFQRAPRDRRTSGAKRKFSLAEELIEIIYGDVIPTEAIFYEPLIHFASHLNFFDQEKEIVGII